MEIIGTLILTTAIAGVAGTGLGGLIGALLQKDSNRTVSLLLSFAGGVMLSVVCFDLVVEAIETNTGILTVIGSIAFGVAIIYLLNYLIDKNTNSEVPHIDENHPKTADDLDELIHSDHYDVHRAKHDNGFALLVAGMVMACAIALHNMPEGMVIGASYAAPDADVRGLAMALVIGLHNIPEGMAVAVPLVSGGMGRVKATILTALTGAPTVLGAALGYFLGTLSPLMLALSLSFASGAMLYVSFGELLPESILMWRSKLPAFAVLIGVFVGMAIVFA